MSESPCYCPEETGKTALQGNPRRNPIGPRLKKKRYSLKLLLHGGREKLRLGREEEFLYLIFKEKSGSGKEQVGPSMISLCINI